MSLFAGYPSRLEAAVPDLAPLSIALVGGGVFSATAPNPRIMVSWGVTNQGRGLASGVWYDEVWFSTYGALDANSVSLGYIPYTQTLAPGASYWQTNQVILPLAGSANYWLFVQTDPQNYVAESDEANNLSTALPGTFTLTPPDLAPQGFAVVGNSAFAATAPSPRVMLSWGVTNQGNGLASGVWYDQVLFSTNGVLDANSVSLGYFPYTQTLAAGASYWETNQVILPLAGSGNYWLFVQTDPQGYVFESNKANNVSAAVPGTFTLTPPRPGPLQLGGGGWQCHREHQPESENHGILGGDQPRQRLGLRDLV